MPVRVQVLDDCLGMVDLTLEHPSVLYHATAERFVDSIMREGLYAEQGDIPVHLAEFDTTDFIASFYPGEPICLITVNVEGLWLGPGWDGGGTWTSHSSIPPDRLTSAPPSCILDDGELTPRQLD